MRFRMLGVGLLAALAAGCGPAGEGGNVAANAQPDAGTDYQERLQAMTEGERNAVFIRAIRDARLECQHVESSAAAGEYRGMPVWNARCTGGGNWTIVVTDDGTAQILNADEARLVGAGEGQPAPSNGQ